MLFTSDRIVCGHSTHQYEKPEWGPLLELAPGHIDDFMWMFEGRAFVYLWPEEILDTDEPGSYREVDPQRILREVLRWRGD